MKITKHKLLCDHVDVKLIILMFSPISTKISFDVLRCATKKLVASVITGFIRGQS